MREYNNKNIVLHELVGLDAEVIASDDSAQVGLKGKVIRETKNLLFLDDKHRTRRIVKKVSTFRFRNANQSFVVNGVEINFRTFERTEKAFKFYRRRRLKQ